MRKITSILLNSPQKFKEEGTIFNSKKDTIRKLPTNIPYVY